MNERLLRWDDRLAIGIADLDHAHHELFDLYNRIRSACEDDDSVSIVREHIRTFLIYARWHFGEEEEFMRQRQYPGLADHKADHARLLQDAEDFVASLGGALEHQDSPAIASYFRYWLTRHFSDKDANFKAFLAESMAESMNESQPRS